MHGPAHRLIATGLVLGLAAPGATAATLLSGPFDDSVASYTLVTNGDMESHSGSTLSSWTDNSGGVLGYDSRAAYSGSGSTGLLDQTWTNTGSGVALRQSVSVTHKSWYVLSGYIYNALSGGGHAYLDLMDVSYTQADGGTGDCSSLSTAGHGDWQFVYCEFYVPNGTHSINVRTVVDSTVYTGSYVYFDEVAITASGSFAPPLSLSADDDGDGYSELDGDCDDDDASLSPGAAEYCDGIDNDCDGSTDEASAVDASTWYFDGDGDGYGDPTATRAACAAPSGYIADGSDCDDSDAGIRPGASERCDGVDNDCDGSVDEASAVDAATWYADADGDGYGDAASTTAACSAPSGYGADSSDCDDGDTGINPGASEYCDGVDNDCDGDVDEDSAVDATAWHPDLDGDGYGDASSSTAACSAPSGYIADGSDCDDHNSAAAPGADEYCNGYDDDCDGAVDEADALDTSTWYADLDGDGYGDPGSPFAACTQPPRTSTDATDCDDSLASVHPGAMEIWYDGIDQDCDGNDDDQDDDGWGIEDDCDEGNPYVNPGATEVWYDGVDQDCSGGSDYDYDGDGYDSESYHGDDCDDADAAVYPGAPDDPYDGVIHDCDASDEYDADGDGFDSHAHGGDDCDDASSQVHPGATEIWYDGIDQDCDGNDDDQDGDGWALEDDCDDTDPDIWPGADGWDEDCNPVNDTGEPPVDDTGIDGPDDSGEPLGGDRYMGGGGMRCGPGGLLAGLWLALAGLGLAIRRRR